MEDRLTLLMKQLLEKVVSEKIIITIAGMTLSDLHRGPMLILESILKGSKVGFKKSRLNSIFDFESGGRIEFIAPKYEGGADGTKRDVLVLFKMQPHNDVARRLIMRTAGDVHEI